jgi:methionyl-tRNA formyltransferase
MLRVYLCGQRHFGADVLRLLLGRASVHVVGVSAPVATLRGDEDKLWRLAGANELPRQVAGELRAHSLPRDTDLIVAAHSHDFIGRRTRRALRLGAIGYHPSLLPLHRGRDAIRWAIRDRDRVTGGSVFWLTDTVDGGPIAAQNWCFVRAGDTAETIWRRDLQPMGLRLIARVLDDIAGGDLVRIPQDHRIATWEPSFDAPSLFRPELPELGCGGWSGYRVVVEATK